MVGIVAWLDEAATDGTNDRGRSADEMCINLRQPAHGVRVRTRRWYPIDQARAQRSCPSILEDRTKNLPVPVSIHRRLTFLASPFRLSSHYSMQLSSAFILAVLILSSLRAAPPATQ